MTLDTVENTYSVSSLSTPSNVRLGRLWILFPLRVLENKFAKLRRCNANSCWEVNVYCTHSMFHSCNQWYSFEIVSHLNQSHNDWQRLILLYWEILIFNPTCLIGLINHTYKSLSLPRFLKELPIDLILLCSIFLLKTNHSFYS